MIRIQMFSHISCHTLQDFSTEFTLAHIDVIVFLSCFRQSVFLSRFRILDGSPKMMPNFIGQFMTDFFEFEFFFVEFNLKIIKLNSTLEFYGKVC